MCHTQPIVSLPPPGPSIAVNDCGVSASAFGDKASDQRIVIIPDIYGASAFYQSLSTFYASHGAYVFLLDPFASVGELPEVTREAAFARRAKLRDRECVDAIEKFSRQHGAVGMVGFCLGGLYVFELSRRELNAKLVSLYGFPQGMPNQDALQIPFDYLDSGVVPQLAIFGETDYLQTPDNFDRLKRISASNPNFSLKLYPKSGHGFLADLDNSDSTLKANAQDALHLTRSVLLDA